jgi:hypothetical protein
VPESILRILDFVAPFVLLIVAMAIPAFAIAAIPFAVHKCALAPRRAKRPFRLRVRIWQLMAAVVVVATALGVMIMTQRAYHAHRKAEKHAMVASAYRSTLGQPKQDFGLSKSEAPFLDALASLDGYFESLERYHEGLRQKYHDLAWHPWRSVSPDPPEPKMPDGLAILGPDFVALVKQGTEMMARAMDDMDSQ